MEISPIPAPLTDDDKAEKRKLAKIAPVLSLLAILVISVTAGLCLSGTINLAGQTTSLSNFGERLEFTAKYQILGVFWLVLQIFNIMIQRNRLNALNPLAGRDTYFKKQSNILQNSFEQVTLSAFAQICLVAFLNGPMTMRTIPLVNFLMFIGRITFYFGYPLYRIFGLFLGLFPTIGMTLVGLYKFFQHLFL